MPLPDLPKYLVPERGFIEGNFHKTDGGKYSARARAKISRQLRRDGAIVEIAGYPFVDTRVYDKPLPSPGEARMTRGPGRPRTVGEPTPHHRLTN